jgi:hypothetical protein
MLQPIGEYQNNICTNVKCITDYFQLVHVDITMNQIAVKTWQDKKRVKEVF